MEEFIRSCVDRYCELAGTSRVREFPTPFIPESHEESPAGAPAARGPVAECPWRCDTFSPPKVYDNIRQLENFKRPRKKSLSESSGAAPSSIPHEGP
eukprot:2809357-Alexandrium_andersonii.AAC.1